MIRSLARAAILATIATIGGLTIGIAGLIAILVTW